MCEAAARTERAAKAQGVRRGVSLDEVRGRFVQSNKRCSFVGKLFYFR